MTSPQPLAVASGPFDNLRAHHIRFLEEAARAGELTVLLWPDETILVTTGQPPRFPLAERRYFLEAVRYVARVVPLPAGTPPNALPPLSGPQPAVWVDECHPGNSARAAFCQQHGLDYRVLSPDQMAGFPTPQPMPSAPGRRKIVATGCYDWFHTGHVRFCEEVSALGDLYVVVGHDANIRLLKGEGHPLFSQEQRRYVVGSIRHVKQALISSGQGWLDADPEIRQLKPDVYAVNEDGDKGGKREYCRQLGIEYRVLQRAPAPGLVPRTSTNLRGF